MSCIARFLGTRTEAGAATAASGISGGRIGEDVGEGRVAEDALDTGGRVVESAVQRAEVPAVLGPRERATLDAPRRLDGRHDVEQRDARRIAPEHEPAVEAAL
jgi:hypothetical protein